MLEKLTLGSNERTMTKLLTQDDYNYNVFNDHIFSLKLEGNNSQESLDESKSKEEEEEE